MIAKATNRIASFFGYDALEPRGRRKSIVRTVNREDHHTKGSKHRGLQETSADLCRNYAIAQWMVRRHLDYVASFDFHGRNDDEDLNNRLEKFMRERSTRKRTDVAGRFGREKLFRIVEARRVLDGDTLLIKLNDGRLQGIQADLIRDPKSARRGEENWVNGVRIGKFGQALEFGVQARKSDTQNEDLRRVKARNAIHYGFFDRYANDQVRGVSPLVAALNPMRDIYENIGYALAKAKVSQLFALAFYRDAEESAGWVESDPDRGESDVDEDGDGDNDPKGYKVDFGGGPVVLDMDPGDRAEFLESNQPSNEFQDFHTLVLQASIKALDIPFSFYDEAHTNFFGSRAAWLHYERSCEDKRNDQKEMRSDYTYFEVASGVRSGELELPRGMNVGEVQFEWVPRGMPWWDPSKEINGHVQAIRGGLDNPQRICRATGTDVFDNIDQIAKVLEYAKEKGVPLEYALAEQPLQVEVAE